jgi:PAB-dependent poly(A)-specific ribonuclease subunit 2
MLDPLVNVFDLKNMSSLPPIPFPSGAAFVRMHPKMLTTTIVTSHVGQIHVVDIMNVNTSNIKHANVSGFLTGMEIAPSGEAMAISSGDSYVLLWGSHSRIRFSELNNPVEFADQEEPHKTIEWEHNTVNAEHDKSQLNNIGMPYYREQLLSAWPSHLISDVGAPPVRIDPQIQASLAHHEFYSTYTYPPHIKPKFRRNEVQNTRTVDKSSASLQAPKFLSERAREASSTNIPSTRRRISDVADAVGAMELESLKADVPAMYRNVEIKYSKFGVDDFDFGYAHPRLCSRIYLTRTILGITTKPSIRVLRYISLTPTPIHYCRF